MNKIISVIVPVYNEEKYIGNLIQNIFEQDFDLKKVELLIVDNNSSDNTSSIVKKLIPSKKPLHIKLLSEPVPGVARARNKGGYEAKGKVLVFIDADNFLPSDFLTNVYKKSFVEGYQAGTIRTLPQEFSVIGFFVFWILETIKITIRRPFGKSFCHKYVFEEVGGYDVDVTPGDNLQFLVKVQKCLRLKNEKISHIKKPIYASMRRFRTHGYISVLSIWLLGYLGWTNAPYTREYNKELLSNLSN